MGRKAPRSATQSPTKPVETIGDSAVSKRGQHRIAELEKQLEHERQLNQRQRSLERLSDDLRALREAIDEEPARPAHRGGHLARESLARNLPFDTQYSQIDARFDDVVHVFHHGWHGIRAAAGYLPGQKLVIPADREMTTEEIRSAITVLSTMRAAVFHGFSRHAENLVKLARRRGLETRLFVVWHGSSSQFHSLAEYSTFSRLLSLKRHGDVTGIGCVKPGLPMLSPHLHQQVLINVPPRTDIRATGKPDGTVLVPVRNNFWKNFHTNVYAAANHPRVRAVFVTSEFIKQRAMPTRAAVKELPEPPRAELLRHMAQSNLVLNVTLTDCQPMTALEALAVGVPCLTGVLELPELSRHEYQRLVTVPGADLLGQISDGITRVFDAMNADLAGFRTMLADYQRGLLKSAHQGWGEFLDT
jgi:hypothetical protein